MKLFKQFCIRKFLHFLFFKIPLTETWNIREDTFDILTLNTQHIIPFAIDMFMVPVNGRQYRLELSHFQIWYFPENEIQSKITKQQNKRKINKHQVGNLSARNSNRKSKTIHKI